MRNKLIDFLVQYTCGYLDDDNRVHTETAAEFASVKQWVICHQCEMTPAKARQNDRCQYVARVIFEPGYEKES